MTLGVTQSQPTRKLISTAGYVSKNISIVRTKQRNKQINVYKSFYYQLLSISLKCIDLSIKVRNDKITDRNKAIKWL